MWFNLSNTFFLDESRNESSKKSKPKEEPSTPSKNNTDSKVFSHEAVKRLLEQYKKYGM